MLNADALLDTLLEVEMVLAGAKALAAVAMHTNTVAVLNFIFFVVCYVLRQQCVNVNVMERQGNECMKIVYRHPSALARSLMFFRRSTGINDVSAWYIF